jgi:hypothetical protein
VNEAQLVGRRQLGSIKVATQLSSPSIEAHGCVCLICLDCCLKPCPTSGLHGQVYRECTRGGLLLPAVAACFSRAEDLFPATPAGAPSSCQGVDAGADRRPHRGDASQHTGVQLAGGIPACIFTMLAATFYLTDAFFTHKWTCGGGGLQHGVCLEPPLWRSVSSSSRPCSYKTH